jgi:hypothetical protein
VGLHAVLKSHVPDLLLRLSGTGLLLFGALCFVAGQARSRVRAPVLRSTREMLDPRIVTAMNLLLFLGMVAAAASLWSY